MRRQRLILTGAILVSGTLGGFAFKGFPSMKVHADGMMSRWQRPTVTIPAYGQADEQNAQFFASTDLAPLVVDLHQWSHDESGFNGNDTPLDQLVRDKGWNFIRPALAGPNNTTKGCCSATVIDGIRAAIDYAKANGHVDAKRIYVVGVSGGGYTALCAAASGKVPAKAFYAWASITDLGSWYNEHATGQYGSDVKQCTGSGLSLNRAEANRRSPFHMPLGSAPVNIYAGIHDGFTGSVPITHSVKLFNRYAQSFAPDQAISADVQVQMLEGREGPDTVKANRIGDRLIHLERRAGPATINIFEGGHEMLARPLIDAIAADAADRPLQVAQR